MAELLLCVTNDAPPPDRYQDGDPICAFSTRRIHATHAHRICHPAVAGFTKDGLRPSGSPSQAWYERTHEFKFVRVGSSVERHALRLGGVDVLSRTPNAKGEQIDVEAFLSRRLAHARHAIFGAPGAEVWYGGSIDESPATVASVWDAIEAGSALRKADHGRWPLTPLEKRHFLALPMKEFDDAEADDMLAQEIDEATGEIVQRRVWSADWRSRVTALQRVRILNRNQEVDLRDTLPRAARLALLARKAARVR